MVSECLNHKLLETEGHSRRVQLRAQLVLTVSSRHEHVATVKDRIWR